MPSLMLTSVTVLFTNSFNICISYAIVYELFLLCHETCWVVVVFLLQSVHLYLGSCVHIYVCLPKIDECFSMIALSYPWNWRIVQPHLWHLADVRVLFTVTRTWSFLSIVTLITFMSGMPNTRFSSFCKILQWHFSATNWFYWVCMIFRSQKKRSKIK